MKLNKRTYTKEMSELTSLKTSVELEIAFRIAAIADRQISMDEGDALNDMHDKVYEIEQEIKALESRWDTRNWTGSDWNTYALIVQNID